MSKNDLAIQALANQCETLADALVKGLETLQVRQSKPRGLESFRVSARAIWRRSDIMKLWKRLSVVENQLPNRISLATSRDQHSDILRVLDRIRQENDCSSSYTSEKLMSSRIRWSVPRCFRIKVFKHIKSRWGSYTGTCLDC